MCLFIHALKFFFDMESLNYTIFICDVNNGSLRPKLFIEHIIFAKHYFRSRRYHYEGKRPKKKQNLCFCGVYGVGRKLNKKVKHTVLKGECHRENWVRKNRKYEEYDLLFI